jgi:ubiquinone/menaquinone biosynthesis C-methylase UbiE
VAVTVKYRGQSIIRDFWEHYTEFPDIYDRFALSSVCAVEELDALFGFARQHVLNVASGTGKESFKIAHRSRRVIGLEASTTMLSFAVARQKALRIDNTRFVRGLAETLPFRDATFGRVLSIHGAPFVGWGYEELSARECLRVVKPGGWVAFVSTPDPSGLTPFLGPLGFDFRALDVEIDFGTLDEALATWGCIYGEEAIDHLLDEQTSKVTLGFGIWWRRK